MRPQHLLADARCGIRVTRVAIRGGALGASRVVSGCALPGASGNASPENALSNDWPDAFRAMAWRDTGATSPDASRSI
jgi:hypothetical protein